MARPLRVRYNRIERLVDELLQRHAVRRPPVNIERIARGEGVSIFSKRLDDDLSGLVFKEGDTIVIGVNSKHPDVRQRFTIAHELGHALLHDLTDVHVDRVFKLRSGLSSQAVDVEEIEANTFAAWILMPRGMVLADLERTALDIASDEAVDSLAERYDVSRQSMSYRVINLLSRSGVAIE